MNTATKKSRAKMGWRKRGQLVPGAYWLRYDGFHMMLASVYRGSQAPGLQFVALSQGARGEPIKDAPLKWEWFGPLPEPKPERTWEEALAAGEG